MNKWQMLLVGEGILILVVIILIISSLQTQKPISSIISPSPTPAIVQNNGNRAISPTPAVQPPLYKLTIPSQNTVQKVGLRLSLAPYITDDFELGYSSVLGKFYVYRKSANAEIQLTQYLNSVSILGLYQDRASSQYLFTSVKQSVKDAIKKDELDLIQRRAGPNPNVQGAYDDRSQVLGTATNSLDQYAPDASGDMTKLSDLSKIFSTFTFGDENDTSTGGGTTGGTTGGPTGNAINNNGTQTLTTNNAINTLLNEAGIHWATPAKLLKAFLAQECGRVIELPEAEVLQYSAPGGQFTGCTSWVGAQGPMQFMSGTWPTWADAVNEATPTFTPSPHTPSVLNIRDSLHAASKMIKASSQTDNKAADWSFDEVRRAVICYNAGCGWLDTPDSGLPAETRNYLNNVWTYYQDPANN